MKPLPAPPPWSGSFDGPRLAGGVGWSILRIGIPFEQRGIIHRRSPRCLLPAQRSQTILPCSSPPDLATAKEPTPRTASYSTSLSTAAAWWPSVNCQLFRS